ncbi:sugar ABC transporter permease [Bifidobacterium dolichotidis]|uniref:Sugar ABC transporter permease n=1 Tax=Bifidobacterium dolichotidis TaxID=2306976 RepID=A0A430FTI6_9BIFI|nr:carbohydrate ABC transporter permease [Bifidobacterium dolichotidis]RSX56189.1 sugar ABC transporter permease [Bifidobacterium dolichotidis]
MTTNRRRWTVRVLAIVFIIAWVFPIYWMLNTAFKPRNGVLEDTPTFWPQRFSLDHFAEVFKSRTFLTSLTNSTIVTLVTVVVSVLVAFLACAALTMYRFRGQRVLMIIILAVQMIPGTAMLIPQFIVFNRFGMLDTYVGLIIAYVAMILPFSIWNMRGFFLAMPMSLFESARVEGANEWQILWHITFPLAAPGIISTSVFAFIHSWNDYLLTYTFMKDQSHYTLPVWLASFSTPTGIDVGAQMAASVLFSLPVVIFFMIVQQRIGQGNVNGAVK